MNGQNLEMRVKNLDERLERIEQFLPTLAAKEDLKGFATKEDLERFATKEDLERFATKEDLERFATKEDLERFATKENLKGFATKEDLEGMPTVDDPKGFATKDDLKHFPTQNDPKGFVTEAYLERALTTHGEREGRLMREFVLETCHQMRLAVRNDMQVLFEQQAGHMRALADGMAAIGGRLTAVDEASRARDAALDGRVLRLENL